MDAFISKARLDVDAVVEAVAGDGTSGFCLECGYEQGGCEPDAQEYTCEACGEEKVFGAEIILMLISQS